MCERVGSITCVDSTDSIGKELLRMTRPDDAQLTDKIAPPAPAAALPPRVACTCDEFRRHQVCDHILMAAAVRMVRRMIVIHADSEKPH